MLFRLSLNKVKMQTSKVKSKKISSKIRRVEGQVAGIGRMYESGRSCLEIAQQIKAARSALDSVAKDLLTDEASRCVQHGKNREFEKLVKSLFSLQN